MVIPTLAVVIMLTAAVLAHYGKKIWHPARHPDWVNHLVWLTLLVLMLVGSIPTLVLWAVRLQLSGGQVDQFR